MNAPACIYFSFKINVYFRGLFQQITSFRTPSILIFFLLGVCFRLITLFRTPSSFDFLPSGGVFPPNHSIPPFPQPYKTSYSSWNNEFSLQNSLAGRSRARVIFQFARIPILVRVCLLYRGKCSNKAKKTCPDSFARVSGQEIAIAHHLMKPGSQGLYPHEPAHKRGIY